MSTVKRVSSSTTTASSSSSSTMKLLSLLLILVAVRHHDPFLPSTHAFSSSLRMMTTSSSEAATLAGSRLREAFSSPSGKLTIGPEIVIPEPSDPTAILLLGSQIKTLSERLRTQAKANSIWVMGPLSSLEQMTAEQEEARGSFPGPLPIIYCPRGDNDDENRSSSLRDIAAAGATAVLKTVSPTVISSPTELSTDDEKSSLDFQTALDCGLQLIPEVLLDYKAVGSWSEEDVASLVTTVVDRYCGGVDPASIVLTLTVDGGAISDDDGGDDDDDGEIVLPSIPKDVKKTIAVLGSVRVLAGDNRMGQYLTCLKNKGFSGAFLRCDCIPGFRMNPDLDAVAKFWTAAIADLKSTKSKTFSFRSKNNMNTHLATKWFNYQKDVMESGALGEHSAASANLDVDGGDFVGF